MYCDGRFIFHFEKFWTQEEVVQPTSAALTGEEIGCEEHFAATHQRTPEGRYLLKLPFKSNIHLLGDSEYAAKQMLFRCEKSFVEQPHLQEKYIEFLTEYAASGHMRVAPTDCSSAEHNPAFYLPHHGVFKTNDNVAKVRVVFNGSIKLRNGLALNSCLHTGPSLQAEIFNILLRWRTHRYVFSADIK